MKKESGLRRLVPVVALDELHAMPTKQLLARLRRLQCCEESAEASDLTEDETRSATGILFKQTDAWARAYADVKAVLDRREHLDR